MKKTLAMLLCGAMTMALLVGCGKTADDASATTSDADAAATTTERTTFVVGFDAEYPPYGYMDDNGGGDGKRSRAGICP